MRDFIQRNYTPYLGDAGFLQGPTERTTAIWQTARRRCSPPSGNAASTTSTPTPRRRSPRTRPATSTRTTRLIVGLQTDAPLKRAIMPNGGWRMVEDALRTYGYQPDPSVKKIFTTYRKTHNQGVFDVYPPDVRAARRSHIITGLPDAYGRGRIIGDYRRVALYGVDALIAAKKAERAELDLLALRRGRHPRPRGEHRADPRPARTQGDGRRATASTSPARPPPRKEAVQWLYFAYLARREGAERRGHVARPDRPPSWTSTCSATWPPA